MEYKTEKDFREPEITTIRVTPQLIKALRSLEYSRKESNENIIRRLLDTTKCKEDKENENDKREDNGNDATSDEQVQRSS